MSFYSTIYIDRQLIIFLHVVSLEQMVELWRESSRVDSDCRNENTRQESKMLENVFTHSLDESISSSQDLQDSRTAPELLTDPSVSPLRWENRDASVLLLRYLKDQ